MIIFYGRSIAFLILATSLLLSACAGSFMTPELVPFPEVTPPAMIVYITDESCPSMEVQSGFTVAWINDGRKEHVVRSEPQAEQDPLVDTGMLQPGDGFSMTFSEPGVIPYICSEDGSLRGTITVTSSDTELELVQPQIGSGVAHTCMVTEQGQVFCWGQGALQGLEINPENFGKPFLLEGLSAMAIGAGWYHTCAALRDGHVQCWGQNASGQLGDGSVQDSPLPADVVDLGGVAALTAGAAHSCALTAGGEVFCWGGNSSGQLGDGTRTDRLTPVQVQGLTGPVISISAGSTFNCALLSEGKVECWGEFGFVPAPEDERIHTSAVLIPNLEKDVWEIAAGTSHLCVLLRANEIRCEGMFGSTNDHPFITTSEDLGKLQGQAVHVRAGTDFNCVLTTEEKVFCWGDNYFDQLGNGTLLNSSEPVQVETAGKPVTALGGGYYTACALITNGAVKCWGDTSFGQTGDGTARWK